jgi:HK97 family phage major capsid protein
VDRAALLFSIKAIDPDQRVIEGIASTPTPDRTGDVMMPEGAQFALPMPFLWHHNSREPIGEVFEAAVTAEGIAIKARVSRVETPGRVKDRVDEAWHSFKANPPLVRGLSIGWQPLEFEAVPKSKHVKHTKWVWGETSAVTIPANVEASITRVKSAALGQDSPGGTGSISLTAHKGARIMTAQEQITGLENRRAAHLARLTEIQNKVSGEGRTKDDAEREEFSTLTSEVKSIDLELVDARDMERFSLQKATPIPSTTTTHAGASELRSGSPIITVTPKLEKGTAFTRFVMAMAHGKGDYFRSMERAKTWHDTTPEVELMVKAAVAAGTTTDATWAGPLVAVKPLVDEFLELLRPRTLLGRIPGLRYVPFNVSVGAQTTGGTYGWVGQNKPKPVTKADYTTVTLTFSKAAGIIVLTEELVKLSTPSAEALVKEEMIAGMGQFLDTQFVDPAVAAVANVNPASITNGAGTSVASGVTGAAAKADLAAQVAAFTAAGIPLEGSVWLMNDSNAFGIAMSINALAQPVFPGMSIEGGSIFGIPVIVSNNVGNRVILVHAPSILVADDGGVSIDVSREASVQMDSAPTDVVDATTVYVSLWQRNLVGLKAERFITWVRARTGAVRYISAAAYTGA